MKIMKSRHNRRSRSVQTPTVEPIKTHCRLKEPGPQLKELLKLVDLVPPKVELPENFVREHGVTPNDLLEALSYLPPALQAHLLQLMNRPEKWPLDPVEVVAERGGDLELMRRACQVSAVTDRYRLIRNSRENFLRIARGGFLETAITIDAMVIRQKKGKKNKALVLMDPFMAAISGEEIDYIRECPICGRIFFARRINSIVHDPKSKCAKTYSKRQERANAKERARIAALAEKNAGKRKEGKKR